MDGKTEVLGVEEEDVSGYWVALRRREDTGNGNRKH
jgi:hypothetical protein